jgi:hypothetical protein
VVGIDRAGAQVAVSAMAFGSQSPPVSLSGRAVSLPPGQYWIGGSVATAGRDGRPPSETLVVRSVTISRSQTVRLDARPGKLVRTSLNVPGAVDEGDEVQACLNGQPSGLWDASAPPGSLYVVPVQAREMAFGYGSDWQTSTTAYYLAQEASGGIPRDPVLHAAAGQLARLNVVLRSNTAVNGDQSLYLERIFGGCGDMYMPNVPLNPAPSSLLQYVSPGSWVTEVLGNQGFWQSAATFAAGHSYADTFGAAVWGPADDEFPTLDFGQLSYFPQEPFADPLQQIGVECCDKSSIALSLRGRTLLRQTLSEQGANRAFFLRVHSTGWYTMRVTAWRFAPGTPIPAGLLSPRETVTWRFSIGAGYDSVDSAVLPVTVTRYVPEGLNVENQAPAGARTTLAVHVELAAQAGWTSHSYPLKTVRIQASFDGGVVWHTLTLVRHDGYWLAIVPAANAGYVSLRSTVTDVHGDSTVQTIYRAYQIG